MRVLVSSLLCLFGAGCVTAESPPPSAQIAEERPALPSKPALPARRLSAHEKSIIQRGLADSLKDPGSIQVKWTLFIPTEKADDVVTYCGQYNAKNSYGGYTGFHPFLSGIITKGGKITGAQIVTAPGQHSQDIQDGVALKVCRDNGLDPFAAES